MRIARSMAAVAAVCLFASSSLATTTVVKGHDANTSSGYAATSNPNSDAAAASFASALAGTSTESFESFATGTTAPLTLNFNGSNGSTLQATLSGSGSVASATRANPTSSGQFAVDGTKYYSVNGANFNIAFSGSGVAAFGFYSTDIESDLQISLTHASGLVETYGYNALFGSSTAPSGSVDFLGLINTSDLIKSVAFGAGSNSSGDIFAFDKMQVGDAQQVVALPSGVPEPATWAMMLMGFGAIGFTLRRNRSAWSVAH